jgi:hypothetical protein
MKRRVGLAGFTIVETMIVLAVTGGLFVTIAATLAGRQRSNEFTQSINDVRNQIQQVVTEVQNGFFPDANYSCTATALGVIIAGGSNTQGKNTGCVFLGKVIQFNVRDQDPAEVIVYPVAGIRAKTDIAAADPSVVRHGLVDASTTFRLKYGLTVEDMRVEGTSIGAFGILSSLDTTTPGKSGDQQFDIYGFTNISLKTTGKLTDNTPSPSLPTNLKNPSTGIQICFKSGGTDQWGLVTIGNNSNQLSVDLQIRNSTCWP